VARRHRGRQGADTWKNFLASTESYLEHKLGGVDEGAVPSSGIESSVTTPDLLFKELDVVPSSRSGCAPGRRCPVEQVSGAVNRP
jgi:hypothetical protein